MSLSPEQITSLAESLQDARVALRLARQGHLAEAFVRIVRAHRGQALEAGMAFNASHVYADCACARIERIRPLLNRVTNAIVEGVKRQARDLESEERIANRYRARSYGHA